MIKDIPTNIITGFLGVGKTTAILNLLKNKPEDEYWAVLVNEFGKVSVDNAVIAGQGDANVVVKEVAGGCVCCTGKVFFTAALVGLIREKQPDRLLIEPTGLGHLSEIEELIRSESFDSVLELRPTICLVDPRRLEEKRVLESVVFQDQVSNAAIILANKSDLATGAQLENFYHWSAKLKPAPIHTGDTSMGMLSMNLLDFGVSTVEKSNKQLSKCALPEFEEGAKIDSIINPKKGEPIRFENSALGHQGCGWVFDPADVFDVDRFKEFLNTNNKMLRIKGVLNTGVKWVIYNCVDGESSSMPVVNQVESRIEVIGESVDVCTLEKQLMNCLL